LGCGFRGVLRARPVHTGCRGLFIFTKLGVSSRAAATAYAYQHRLF
jgi:hypothetical protein